MAAAAASAAVKTVTTVPGPRPTLGPNVVAVLERCCPRSPTSTDETGRRVWAEAVAEAVATRFPDTTEALRQVRRIASNCKTNAERLGQLPPDELAAMTSEQMAGGKRRRVDRGWPEPPAVLPGFPPDRDGWAAATERSLTIVVLAHDKVKRAAFEHVFRSVPRVSVVIGDVRTVHADGAVDVFLSSANEFGNMDGGVDRVYAEMFGWSYGEPYHDANPLQRMIREVAGPDAGFASIPVGEALLVPAGTVSFIAAPTMRYPGAHAPGNRSTFKGARAAFTLWRATDGIPRATTIPFGTDWGGLPYDVAAAQMWEAFVEAWTL
eukprot:m.20663 g.20663  ORF g.20663 m.20663 type:complete len:322 (-) comp10268_c0_seq1:174-1139(-)